MTLRGCILGDSHLAALRLAAHDCGLSGLDFIGSPQAGLADVALQDGTLRPTSDSTRADFRRFGGRDHIILRDYDFFAITGLGVSVFALAPLYRAMRFMALPSVMAGAEGPALVSRACFRLALVEKLQGSLAVRLVRLLQTATPAPLFIIPQPRPSEIILRHPRAGLGFRQMRQGGDAGMLDALFGQAMAVALPVPCLAQPLATVTDNLFTRQSFCTGSVRLRGDVAHPVDDYLHANGDYGALVLAQLRDAVAGRTTTD